MSVVRTLTIKGYLPWTLAASSRTLRWFLYPKLTGTVWGYCTCWTGTHAVVEREKCVDFDKQCLAGYC